MIWGIIRLLYNVFNTFCGTSLESFLIIASDLATFEHILLMCIAKFKLLSMCIPRNFTLLTYVIGRLHILIMGSVSTLSFV